MNNGGWIRAAKGEPGLQGPAGASCKCELKPETARYITSGGKRSLYPGDSIVILKSDEKVTLILPEVELKELCDDQYYYAKKVTIMSLGGRHVVTSQGEKINGYTNQVELSDEAAKYEFTSIPGGWLLLIFKSLTD